MTLFRKVFQNQSREATEFDAPDEEALREAMQEAAADSSPLGLDPFAVETAEVQQAEEAEAYDDLIGEPAEAAVPEEASGRPIDVPDMPDEAGPEGTDDTETHEAGSPVAEDAPVSDDVSAAEAEVEEVEEEEGETDISALLALAREATPAEAEQVEENASVTDSDDGSTPANDTSGEESTFAGSAGGGEIDLSAFARDQLSAQSATVAAASAPSEEVEPLQSPASAGTDLSGLPAPAAGRAGRRAGRVKTRLLGFNRGEPDPADPFGAVNEATAAPQHEKFPVGWLVVVEGPGVGHSFSIFSGASMIGRGEDQMIRLDFGDNSISRQNHAAIAYDEEQNKFYLGHGGKSNIIRRNARPVLATEELNHADLIRIGETTLRFVALCGSDFKWEMTEDGHAASF
ncbi:FHA domain-containing protein [uncultured Roseobacter sp.]|uniref:FHA domain-containing protein n=1 Tax=uncultured Roseobacter sp. TaxID=114847 RepID=UPI00260A0F66|nr:FHA domain-containing protein [uncultured Roseobacter sp.]